MYKPLRLGLRVGMGLGLSLAVSAGGCSLGQNFNQCQVDSDCPASASGQKLFCTQDNLCSVGTPASKLCGEVYPANSPANAIVIGVLTNIQQGSDALPVLAFEQAIDEMNALRVSTGDRQFSLHLCEISATPDDPLKSMKILAREHGAVAVLGPSSSSFVLNIAPEVIASQVLRGNRLVDLYTVVKQHDAYTKNVQTVEVDVQDTIERRIRDDQRFFRGASFYIDAVIVSGKLAYHPRIHTEWFRPRIDIILQQFPGIRGRFIIQHPVNIALAFELVFNRIGDEHFKNRFCPGRSPAVIQRGIADKLLDKFAVTV